MIALPMQLKSYLFRPQLSTNRSTTWSNLEFWLRGQESVATGLAFRYFS